MKKASIMLILVVGLSILLTACGGGGGGGGASTTIEADMQDFKFVPAEWTVPAGEEISLELTTTGAVEHEWALMIRPVTLPFDADDEPNVDAEFSQQPGENATVTFTAPTEPGDYEVVCGIPGHLEAGMKGTLHVVEQ